MIFVKKKEFYSFEKDGLTSSFLQTFLACRTKAKLSYQQGWTSVFSSNPMVFGSLFHNCLEKVYRLFQLSVPLEQINIQKTILTVLNEHKKEVQAQRIWSGEDEQNHVLNQGYLEAVFPKYLEKYGKKDQKYKWALVEEQFANQYKGVLLRGKFDRVAVNQNNETWIFETKTKSRIDPEIQNRLSFDPQVMMYTLNYELATKIKPIGFVYDCIQRPSLRKRANETLKHFIDRVKNDVDDSYFFRIQQRIDKEEWQMWLKEFEQMLTEFKLWIKGELPTYRNVSSCENRYGNCAFIRACGLGEYTGLVKRKYVMPELTNV